MSKKNRITQKEFWDILGRTKNWELDNIDGHIRTLNSVCPVCAVANLKMKKFRFTCDDWDASQYLGLTDDFRSSIVKAADNYEYVGEKIQKLRQKLLKVCKLT